MIEPHKNALLAQKYAKKIAEKIPPSTGISADGFEFAPILFDLIDEAYLLGTQDTLRDPTLP
jgi:hypothetical protein